MTQKVLVDFFFALLFLKLSLLIIYCSLEIFTIDVTCDKLVVNK